jgi:hypothetical protein
MTSFRHGGLLPLAGWFQSLRDAALVSTLKGAGAAQRNACCQMSTPLRNEKKLPSDLSFVQCMPQRTQLNPASIPGMDFAKQRKDD